MQPITLRDAGGRFLPGSTPPGPRGRGGQPGDLNSVRNPWATYWRRRALGNEDRWALQLVRDYVPQLVSDKGGEENVSFAELKVMELAVAARVCWVLALAGGDLAAAARFMGREQAAVDSIGHGRRAREVPSLREYLRPRAGAAASGSAE